jgi:hypothetical protein
MVRRLSLVAMVRDKPKRAIAQIITLSSSSSPCEDQATCWDASATLHRSLGKDSFTRQCAGGLCAVVVNADVAAIGLLRSEVFGLRSRESEGLCGIVLRELAFSE